jgi:CubicO group peptidase (beta-lactamase class C family)
MIDLRSDIRQLLLRAIRAGSAPAAVAEWGRAGAEPFRSVVGNASLFPAITEATASTWFDLASLTKPLVTTTLTILAFRSGLLTRSTRVGEVLGETEQSAIADLAVEDLLTHTGGLPAWLPLYCIADGDPNALPSRLAEIEPEAPPGEKVVYSDVGFVTLGLMVARIGGGTLESLFVEQVLKPLGLDKELGFCPDSATQSLSGGSPKAFVERRMVDEMGFDACLIPPIAAALPDDGNARFLDGVAGHAGLFGTARGVGVLASEYLPGGGRLLSEPEAADAIRLRTSDLEQARSWGWQLASSPQCSAGEGLSQTGFGHTGFTGGSVWSDPETSGVFVLLTNRNHPVQRENDLHPLRRRFHALASRSLQR